MLHDVEKKESQASTIKNLSDTSIVDYRVSMTGLPITLIKNSDTNEEKISVHLPNNEKSYDYNLKNNTQTNPQFSSSHAVNATDFLMSIEEPNNSVQLLALSSKGNQKVTTIINMDREEFDSLNRLPHTLTHDADLIYIKKNQNSLNQTSTTLHFINYSRDISITRSLALTDPDVFDLISPCKNTLLVLSNTTLLLISKGQNKYKWSIDSVTPLPYDAKSTSHFNYIVPLNAKQVVLIANGKTTSLVIFDMEKLTFSATWFLNLPLEFNRKNRYAIRQGFHTLIAKSDNAIYSLDVSNFSIKKIMQIKTTDIYVINHQFLYTYELDKNKLISISLVNNYHNNIIQTIAQQTNILIDVAKIIYEYTQDDLFIECSKVTIQDSKEECRFLEELHRQMNHVYVNNEQKGLGKKIDWVFKNYKNILDSNNNIEPAYTIIGLLLTIKKQAAESAPSWKTTFFNKKDLFATHIDDIIERYRKQFGKNQAIYSDDYFLSFSSTIEDSIEYCIFTMGLI